MKRGLVISDLHLFSPRSVGTSLLTEIEEDLAGADVLVLNGDIFDFRWSCLPTEAATISAAMQWMENLLQEHPGKPVHYLLGNHDCLSEFRAQLEDLTKDQPNLTCHEFQLRLDRNLFLHGDCANRKMDEETLRRFRDTWSRDRPRGQLGKKLYDGVDAIGISRQVHKWYFPERRTVQRVAHHLNHTLPEWRNCIDHCYFGHTHQPFSNHAFEGVQFHNTGSGIRGMGFQPLPFQTCSHQD